MKIKIVTSVLFTLAIFSMLIFQSFTAEENSKNSAPWINGYIYKFGECPQQTGQAGANYIIRNVTNGKIIGSGVTDNVGLYRSGDMQGTQGGDRIRVTANYQNKSACLYFNMPKSGDAHENLCIFYKGGCPDEE